MTGKNKSIKLDKLPTIRRLPSYLQYLRRTAASGVEFVSSAQLAEVLGIEPILVRKDLELTGISGTPRLGYRVRELMRLIENYLGWGDTTDAFLLGAGSFGSALMGYRELLEQNLKIVAAFDVDPEKISRAVHGIPVFCISKLSELARRLNVRLAVLTLPADAAQEVTDLLVEAGVQGIWNFTTASLRVPDGVVTHNENLFSGLAVLSVMMGRAPSAV